MAGHEIKNFSPKSELNLILKSLFNRCNANGLAGAASQISTLIDELHPRNGEHELSFEKYYDISIEAYNIVKIYVTDQQIDPLSEVTKDLLKYIEVLRNLLMNKASVTANDANALRKLFEQQSEEINRKTSEMLTKLNSLESDFEARAGSVDHAAKAATDQISSLLKNTQAYAAEQANTAIYKDYKSSAAAEKKVSDNYRNYSITAMTSTALVAIASIIEASLSSLSATQIITRIALSVILGVMAAYFARESSKHRKQQYLYQQFSLNLNALPLFIADLDVPAKNTLKSELARIIFTTSHENEGDKSSYPLDMQELMLALIDKLPPRAK